MCRRREPSESYDHFEFVDGHCAPVRETSHKNCNTRDNCWSLRVSTNLLRASCRWPPSRLSSSLGGLRFRHFREIRVNFLQTLWDVLPMHELATLFTMRSSRSVVRVSLGRDVVKYPSMIALNVSRAVAMKPTKTYKLVREGSMSRPMQSTYSNSNHTLIYIHRLFHFGVALLQVVGTTAVSHIFGMCSVRERSQRLKSG